VVLIGALQNGEKWRALMPLLMHPEAIGEKSLPDEPPFNEDDLRGALAALSTNQPYMTTLLWRSRAQRALIYSGDAADAVISFQIAAESMLFDTYRMLLIDEGRSSVEIASELTDLPFKVLVTSRLPKKLGGSWDVTLAGTPMGDYWQKLYLMRNSIVHVGFQAHGGNAADAQAAYWGLRDHLEQRLWANHRAYPGTLVVRLGAEQLAQRGWLTKAMRQFIEGLKTVPGPFYWPHDRRIPGGNA
jgi:hypothetical protein